MKTFLSCFLFMNVAIVSYAQSGDQRAIREVIEAESRSYHTNPDRKIYFTYWQITPQSRWAYSSKDWREFMNGEDIKAMIASNAYPPADNAKGTFSDFSIKVSNKVGWATFDVKAIDPEGKESFAHSFYCLEKIGGAWKIISASEHGYTPEGN